jgi:elongation of very long chain fatty acids protein 4
MAAEVWQAWDGFCTEAMRGMFVRIGFEELLSPPASPSKNLPFVESPTVLVTCIVVYLTVVCGSLVASAFSRKEVKRDSFLLRAFVQLHNLFLIGLSSYMCISIIWEAVANGYTFWGNDFNPREKRMAELIHLFYVSKMYEFLDTVRILQHGGLRLCSTQFRTTQTAIIANGLSTDKRYGIEHAPACMLRRALLLCLALVA